jgi:uncharacterized protein
MKQRMRFEVGGTPVLADLYRPAGGGPHPAVVVAGPMTSVKEQVAGVYAAALAVRGIAALALDHRHYGESGGEPRQYENPAAKIEDLRAAVDLLAGHPALDPGRLALVGVCLGAGYAAAATPGAPLVRALATVAGYFPDPHAMRASSPEPFEAEILSGAQARAAYEGGAEPRYVLAAGGPGAPMSHPDIVEYYATPRAGLPNYRNAFAVMSREVWLAFDAQAAAPQLRVPVGFVHAERALAPHWAEAFAARAPLAQPVEWVPAAGQADFYDNPERIDDAADRVAAMLRRAWTAAA